MLATVEFDDEQSLATNEIDDVWADWILADKFQSGDASVANEVPKGTLGLGHPCAQVARTRDCLAWPNCPHPALRATLSPVGRGDVADLITGARHGTISAVSTTA
jgi:hypothetical protein